MASDGYLIGSTHHNTVKTCETTDTIGSTDFLKDQENYKLLLKFYDGICRWEEGSPNPVLHVTWAQHFNSVISKFVGSVRERLEVEKGSDEEGSSSSSCSSEDDSEVAPTGEKNRKRKRKSHRHSQVVTRSVPSRQTADTSPTATKAVDYGKQSNTDTTGSKKDNSRHRSTSVSSSNSNHQKSPLMDTAFIPSPAAVESKYTPPLSPEFIKDNNTLDNNNEVNVKSGDNSCLVAGEKIKSKLTELVSKVSNDSSEESQSDSRDSKIADLAKKCGESILNPDFLLGRGEPFTTRTDLSLPPVFRTLDSDFSLNSNRYDLNNKTSGHQTLPSITSAFMASGSSHLFVDDSQKLLKPHTQSKPTCETLASSPKPDDKTTTLVNRSSMVSQSYVIDNGIESPLSAMNPNTSGSINDDVVLPTGGSTCIDGDSSPSISQPQHVKLQLHSVKMKGLKHLLLSDKLNTNAINLQLTAQSQVHFRGARSKNKMVDYGGPRKRQRKVTTN